jgi:hypothetical protein
MKRISAMSVAEPKERKLPKKYLDPASERIFLQSLHSINPQIHMTLVIKRIGLIEEQYFQNENFNCIV